MNMVLALEFKLSNGITSFFQYCARGPCRIYHCA